MKIEDIKKGMLVHISNDNKSRSLVDLGSNFFKVKMVGTTHIVDKIIFQESNNRYIIRINSNHWFPEDLESAILPEEGLKMNPELQTEPQLFDPNQLMTE